MIIIPRIKWVYFFIFDHLHTPRVLSPLPSITMITIAINRDWVYNQVSTLSNDIHAIAHSLVAFVYLFDLISIRRLSNDTF